jgi:hypothetical protein
MSLKDLIFHVKWFFYKPISKLIWNLKRPFVYFQRIEIGKRVAAYIAQEPRIASFEFTSDAVAVMGDKRVVGPAIILTLHNKQWAENPEEVREIATDIINRTPGLVRVLIEIR